MSVYFGHSLFAKTPIQNLNVAGVCLGVLGKVLYHCIAFLTGQIRRDLQQLVRKVVIKMLALACSLPCNLIRIRLVGQPQKQRVRRQSMWLAKVPLSCTATPGRHPESCTSEGNRSGFVWYLFPHPLRLTDVL